MGLCLSVESDDHEDIKRYDGQSCLCFKHGEGTYLYENGDMYRGEWRWNKKHGHGLYTHKNGEIKQGFFYRDEYIGREPGELFAVTRCSCWRGCAPSQPLLSEEEKRNMEKLEAARQRQAEREKEREQRKLRRDEIRKKYNLPEARM